MKSLVKKISNEFRNRFKTVPLVIRSPGRVNLLGEHTDYNDGFVLPAAINKHVVLAMAPNKLGKIRLHGIDMNLPDYEADLNSQLNKTDQHWPNYVLGVVKQLKKKELSIHGFDCVIGGNIPVGAGLSSSAAVVGGVVFGLSTLFHLELDRLEMARIGQKAENDFVGVQCGIMDHFANIFGQKGQVIKLDCRSFDHEYYPFKGNDLKIVLFDSGIRRELASTGYNVRRLQCEEGVNYLKQFDPDIYNLRDVSSSLLESHKENLDPVVYRRCRYVLDENSRVEAACNELIKGDFNMFGKWMYASHYGLRDQYEVSCQELDMLISVTEDLEGVIGARMMGGGFGGCTINLIKNDHLDSHVNHIADRYRKKTGVHPEIHFVDIAGGTDLISMPDKAVVNE